MIIEVEVKRRFGPLEERGVRPVRPFPGKHAIRQQPCLKAVIRAKAGKPSEDVSVLGAPGAVSCELGLKETTGPTGGTQKGELGWPH